MVDDRRERILKAALEVFLRYGFRRATMDDIASEVGISRPALYLSFSGKEDLLRAVVERGLDEMLREIHAGLAGHASLAAQLQHVFEVWSVRPFEVVARSPAAGELMGGSYDFASDVFERGAEQLTQVVSGAIRAAVGEAIALQPSAQVVARIMIAAAHGFKSVARDAQDLRGLIHDLIQLVVTALPLPASRPVSVRGRVAGAGKKASRPAK